MNIEIEYFLQQLGIDPVLDLGKVSDSLDSISGINDLIGLLAPSLASLLLLLLQLLLDQLLLQPVLMHLMPHDAFESLLFRRQNQLVYFSVTDV